MAEQQRGRRAIEVGPTGRAVAANIARLRERRGLTTRQLSAALERAGRAVPASGITRMEKAERVVTADELAAFAAVFGVSPSALLLPMTVRADDDVEVTGGGHAPAAEAWAWANGQRPLILTPGIEQTQMLEYQLFGKPQWLREPSHLILRGERGPEELQQARRKYELLASIGGASLDRLKELDPEAFEVGGDG
ncbi:helix-turn-helix domain-containing protein [Streptomyces sp. NPDC048338]|uniref:helix-turn-helix domain-containing protein n=1 Tax=Streptomyces sp. NPDC048338 TaxID=3365536 RepID=UPI0037241D1F